jgi:AAHS family 4-hydroxybenzoate transporter-like MFS transporter
MKPQAVINVQTFINESRFSGYQWLAFGLCFVIVLLDGFDTGAIAYVAPSLIVEWGIAKPALAPVLSAALFGVAAGALSAGPLADRLGRRGVLIVSVLVFGLACLASSFSADLPQLTMARFVTGLGLGAAMPNAVTLVSEFCPDSRRAMLTNAMFCGFPLGAACGGFLAAWIIPQWGWRAVLVVGGAAPLALVVLLWFSLPESVRYLVAKGLPDERVRAVLCRISATASAAEGFVITEKSVASSGGRGLSVVLSRSYVVGSAMLWIAYFMGLVIIYALLNWMPILLRDAGLAPRDATLVSALAPLGASGAILFGWLMDRVNGDRVIAVAYALASVAVYSMGLVAGTSFAFLVVTVLVAGTLMNTAQTSLPALAAAFYPTQGRATGVAWMLGIGRFGAIVGSFLVAELIRRHLGTSSIFALISIAGVISAVALMVKQLSAPSA